MLSLNVGGSVLLVAICATGAWLDLRYRLLPNWLCALALLAGLSATFTAEAFSGSISALLHSCIALSVGMVLFGARLIGGGDAKFYAALAGWFPLSSSVRLLIAVALCGL